MNLARSPIVRQVAPDRLEVKEGGGCLALFGVPFLAAGIFVALIAARIVPVKNAADVPAWAWPLILLMGLAFVAVGGGLVLGRRWTILDAGRGTILKQWGLLVPMRGETHSLADYDAVVVRFEAGDSDSADRYPVLLRAKGGGADLALQSATQYGESREAAAAIAKFLRLPLVDAATTHESVLAADLADAPFPEQPPGADLRGDSPRPLRMQSQVRESSRTLEIILPGHPGGASPGREALADACRLRTRAPAERAPSRRQLAGRDLVPEVLGIQAVQAPVRRFALGVHEKGDRAAGGARQGDVVRGVENRNLL